MEKVALSTMYGVFGSEALPSYQPDPKPLPYQQDYEKLLKGLKTERNHNGNL